MLSIATNDGLHRALVVARAGLEQGGLRSPPCSGGRLRAGQVREPRGGFSRPAGVALVPQVFLPLSAGLVSEGEIRKGESSIETRWEEGGVAIDSPIGRRQRQHQIE